MSLVSRTVLITNRRGLHARASAKFVTLASGLGLIVDVEKDGNKVVGTSIMGLMMLGASIGSTLKLEAEGSDAEAAIAALTALVDDLFGEGE